MKNYTGRDFSADWKVVTYEGKTVLAQWSYVRDSQTKEILGVTQSESKSLSALAGFDNYRWAAQAARLFGGVAVRQ
jgi:hypothetical protein